jgi:threonine/homoserine/homoserine lactone efflux protein
MVQAISAATSQALAVEGLRWGPVGGLLLTSLAIMGSPGPSTISLVAVGSTYGVHRSIGYVVGLILGTIIVLIAVAAGLTAALLALPAAEPVVIGISAVYILWLAYHIATAPPLTEQGDGLDAPSTVGGILLGVSNPKAWIAIAAVFGTAQLADTATSDGAAKIVVLTATIVVIHALWLITGASLGTLLRDPRRARIVNATLAMLLVAATAHALLP